MRGIGIVLIALSMMVVGIMAIPASPSAPLFQSGPTPGIYKTEWGDVHFTRFHERGGTFRFSDGSHISGQFSGADGTGRFIGTWLRVRPRSGARPVGVDWAQQCERRPSVHPADFRDPETRWWGTVLISFRGDGFTGHFTSCRLLPHRPSDQREGLHGTLYSADRPPLKIGKVTQPSAATLEAAMRASARPCAAAPLAIATPTLPCRLVQTENFGLRVHGPIPAGNGRVIFTPLSPDNAAIIAWLRGLGPMPADSRREPVTLWFRSTNPFAAGNWLALEQPRTLCTSDVWALSMIDPRGRRHDRIGVVRAMCGPGELGSLRD